MQMIHRHSIDYATLTHRPRFNKLTLGSVLLGGLLLTGCQVSPTATPAPIVKPTLTPPQQPPLLEQKPDTRSGPVTPLPELAEAPLTPQRLPNDAESTRPTIVPLPQPAPRSGVRRDGHNIPAFNSLLNIAREQIAQAKWADAEQTLTRAQRMAPDSAAVYAHFAEIAIKRQQWNRADSMARRGLLLTQNPTQQRTFWQIVLLSAQQQNNARSMQEAQRQLGLLRTVTP